MKLYALFLSLALAFTPVVAAEDTPGSGVIKEVCHPKKDKAGKEVKDRQGKVVQECKKIRVRKKLEGTEIPEKKK
jgi:hypothetical protein